MKPTEASVESTVRLPDYLIIGAPRSGTTALHRYLGDHPGVFLAERKELNFFNRQEPSQAAIKRYSMNFALARPDQVAGEATPLYLSSPEAPRRIAQVVPDARLVAILRQPVDRAYSHYWWRKVWRAEDRSFAQAVHDELAGNAPPGADYLACGLYGQQLARLCEHMPARALKVMLLDDLIADAGATFAGICRHIGADAEIRPTIVGDRINATGDIRSLRLWRAMRHWRGQQGRRYAFARFIDRRNSYSVVPPPMDLALRRELMAYFSRPIDELAQWLDRDLAHWHT